MIALSLLSLSLSTVMAQSFYYQQANNGYDPSSFPTRQHPAYNPYPDYPPNGDNGYSYSYSYQVPPYNPYPQPAYPIQPAPIQQETPTPIVAPTPQPTSTPQETAPIPPDSPAPVPGSPSPSTSKPSECLPIDATSACAPWAAGYYINATELGLVYGLNKDGGKGVIPNVSYWDALIYASTSGGDFQAKLWKEWAQCPGYKGEPIQYARTYVCLTDIFLFSAKCNDKPPTPAPCPDTCQLYGQSLDVLLKTSEACPPLDSFKHDDKMFKEVESRRSILASAAKGCQDILNSWSTGSFKGQTSKSGFSSGAFATDFKPEQFQSCPSDKFIDGVDDDTFYCGFAGNLDAAKAYCKDFGAAPCCQKLKNESHTAPTFSSTSSLQSALNVQADTATPSAAAASGLGAGIIALIVVGCLAIIAIPAVLFVRWRRAKRVAPGANSAPLMKNASPASLSEVKVAGMTAEPAMKSDSRGRKYLVEHEYIKKLPDELELRLGDLVRVSEIYDDGWAKGRNVTTGCEGAFPMACLREV